MSWIKVPEISIFPTYSHSIMLGVRGPAQGIPGGKKILTRFDIYICLRSLKLLVMLLAIFVSINWIRLAVEAVEGLVSGGQSGWSVIEYILLLIPLSFSNAVAMSSFFALTYLFFRLNSDREIIAVNYAGMDPAQVVKPFLLMAALASTLLALLEHIIVPLSESRATEISTLIQHDLTNVRITSGQFLFPVEGVAVFVGKVGEDGSLQNVFIHDARTHDRERTYYSEDAILGHGEFGLVLELSSGHAEEWDETEAEIKILTFEAIRFNLDREDEPEPVSNQGLRFRSSLDLAGSWLAPAVDGTDQLRGYAIEINSRFFDSLRSLVYPMLGVMMLLVAETFRFQRHIAFVPAILAVIVMHVFGQYMEDKVEAGSSPVALIHLSHVIALLLAGLFLHWSRSPPPQIVRLLSHSRHLR